MGPMKARPRPSHEQRDRRPPPAKGQASAATPAPGPFSSILALRTAQGQGVREAYFTPPVDEGRPLGPAVRGRLERRFGSTLSDVRVHDGSDAARDAAAVGADAFTVGRDIFLGEAANRPPLHRALVLEHEVGHAVQQGSRGASGWLPDASADAERNAGTPSPGSEAPSIARSPEFEDLLSEFHRSVTLSRATRRARGVALAEMITSHRADHGDVVSHGTEVVDFLLGEGLVAEAGGVLDSMETSWFVESVSESPTVGSPSPFAHVGDALFDRAMAAARSGNHNLAFRLFGVRYLQLQVQLVALGNERTATAQAAPDDPAAAAATAGVLSRLPTLAGTSAYGRMRDILGAYETLAAEARAAGDTARAASLSGLGLALHGEIRDEWTVGGDLMIAEVTPTMTARGPGLTLHGSNAESIELLEFPGMPSPAELEPGTFQQQGAADIREALFRQGELMAELMAVPEIQAAFPGTTPDLHDEDQRHRVWVTMYGVYQREDTLGLGVLYRLMSLVGRYLRAFTIHTGYNIRDWGTSYLDTPLPADLLGRFEMDCGVYAVTTAWEVYRVARAVRPRPNLDFEILSTPSHVELIITDVDRGEMYLVNNDTISPPRRGDLLEEGARGMVPVSGEGYVATWAFRMPLGSTRTGTRAFRRNLWENYLDAVNVGLGPEDPIDATDTRTRDERFEDAHRHFYENQERFDDAARGLRRRLDELARVAGASTDERASLSTGLGALLPAASGLLGLFRDLSVAPRPGLVLDRSRESRRAQLNRVGRQVFLFTSERPGEVHPLIRLAEALLRLESLGETLDADERRFIEAMDAIEPFHRELESFRARGIPPAF